MKYKKIREDYWNFSKEIQERYLCIKEQFGVLESKKWLGNIGFIYEALKLMAQMEVTPQELMFVEVGLLKEGYE